MSIKKMISAALAAAATVSCCAVSAFADEGSTSKTIEITADKMAQWVQNQNDSDSYDGRIHGWGEWYTAVYMGFTLPEDCEPENVTQAVVAVYTESIKKTGNAYLRAVPYDDFENGEYYKGVEPLGTSDVNTGYNYTAYETGWSNNTKATYYITDYIKSNNSKEVAIQLDTMSSDNKANEWVIGTLNDNNGKAPKLILTYTPTETADGPENEGVEATKVEVSAEAGETADTVGFTYNYSGSGNAETITWVVSNGEKTVNVDGKAPIITTENSGGAIIGLLIKNVPADKVEDITAKVVVE